MKFIIPFTLSSLDRLKKRSELFKKFAGQKRSKKLNFYLESGAVGLTGEEYLAICARGFVFSFILTFVILSTALYFLAVSKMFLISSASAFLLSCFVYFVRVIYPKVYSTRRQREIESNLIPALEDMVVQFSSGIPLFSVLVNVSSSDYGVLSEEFKKIVSRINAGLPQADVLEETGEKNPSPLFRRTLWQISNGLRSGSDVSIIIGENIRALEAEQLIQIQNYGNKLNPMIMFYMLISVILPALAITFMTVVTSLISMSGTSAQVLFIILFVSVVLVQIAFLGIIKSIRPSLL